MSEKRRRLEDLTAEDFTPSSEVEVIHSWDQIPHFNSEEEAAEWWHRHSLAEPLWSRTRRGPPARWAERAAAERARRGYEGGAREARAPGPAGLQFEADQGGRTREDRILLDPDANSLYSSLKGLSWDRDATVRSEVNENAAGSSAEDELLVLLAWLDHCEIVHRLDRSSLPRKAARRYRVPSACAVFRLSDGRHQAALIEVESSDAETLVWSASRMRQFRRYADDLRLPLLVAWRRHGLWSLDELQHFTRAGSRYVLPFGIALRESLMSALAGDFAVTLKDGVGLHVQFVKEQEQEGEGGTRVVDARISDAYYTNGSGDRVGHLGAGVWWALAATNSDEAVREIDGHIEYELIKLPNDGMVLAQGILKTAMLSSSEEAGGGIQWSRFLGEYPLPLDYGDLTQGVEQGLKSGTVRYIFHFQPATKTKFFESLGRREPSEPVLLDFAELASARLSKRNEARRGLIIRATA